jgi:hypothetical protein
MDAMIKNDSIMSNKVSYNKPKGRLKVVLMTIGMLSFVGMFVFIYMSYRSWKKKDGKLKRNLSIAGSCFVLMVICASLDDTPVENQVADKEEVKEIAVSKEVVNKDAEEDKAKAEIAKVTAASEAEDNQKEAEAKLKLEEDKKKAELEKQAAAKTKAEEAKKKEAAKVAEKASSEEVINTTLQAMVMASEGVILEIRQNPYGSLDWQQMQVVVSDSWYESPEHEKERFAESISEIVESVIYQSGVVKTGQIILTHFLDSYDKELATEKVFGGYKIKR